MEKGSIGRGIVTTLTFQAKTSHSEARNHLRLARAASRRHPWQRRIGSGFLSTSNQRKQQMLLQVRFRRCYQFGSLKLPNARIVDLSHTCAASDCILSCQIMTYLNAPIAAGASRILVTFLGASSSAIRRGTVADHVRHACDTHGDGVLSHYQRTAPFLTDSRQVLVWMGLNAANNVHGNMFCS